MSISHPRITEVLVIDDNPGDIRLITEALRSEDGQVIVNSVSDGLEAIRSLTDGRSGAIGHHPDLIILDLNMPGCDGREILRQLRSTEATKLIPVMIFTSSSARWDVKNAYEVGANCYVTKPATLDLFFQALHSFRAFWIETANLPGVSRND